MRILLTGVSSGLGLELARLFLDAGDSVIGISRRQPEKRLASNDQFLWIQADLSKAKDIQSICETASRHFKSLDLLINNAALLRRAVLSVIHPEDCMETWQVNVMAPVLLIQGLRGLLREGNNPQIINIGSMSGIQGAKKYAGLAIYSGTKSALVGITEVLAEELMEEGIRINLFAAGALDTQMFKMAFPESNQEGEHPEKIARLIYELSKIKSSLFTGKVLPMASTEPL